MKTQELTFTIWWNLLRKHTRLLAKELTKVIGIIIAGILKLIANIIWWIYIALRWVWNKVLTFVDKYSRLCVALSLVVAVIASTAFFVNGRAKEETLSHKVDSLKLLNDRIMECSRYDEGFTAGLIQADTMNKETK